jgi:Acetyltransferase (GNAT) domain
VKSLQIRVYETLDELEGLRLDWEELLAEFTAATSFSTWEWLVPWWRAFGGGRQLLVLGFFDGLSRLVGLAPLSVEKRHVAPFLNLGVLCLWGDGSGDSDNLDFPVRPGYEDQVALALLDYLGKESKRWDSCELNTMPECSLVGTRLYHLLEQRSWTAYSNQSMAAAVPLPDTWEAYLSQLSPKERGKIRYYTKRLGRKYRVHLRRCASEKDLPECLETLFRLHQKRWQFLGEPGTFRLSARRQFYYEISRQFMSRGWLEFWVLEVDGKPVAAQFGFRYGDTVVQLQEGYDPDYSTDSIGYVLRAHVIKELIATGTRRYDFLSGETPSKARWAAQRHHYVNIHFAKPSTKGSVYLQIVHRAGQSKEWLRARLPQNAWQVLQKLNRKLPGNRRSTKLPPVALSIFRS